MHRTVHTARVWRDRDQIPLKMVPRYTLSSTRANGQLRRVPRAQRARTRTEAGVDQGSLVPERIERAGVGPCVGGLFGPGQRVSQGLRAHRSQPASSQGRSVVVQLPTGGAVGWDRWRLTG